MIRKDRFIKTIGHYQNGRKRTISRLRGHCKKWNEEQWEEYLKTLEGSCRELLIGNPDGFAAKYSGLKYELQLEEERGEKKRRSLTVTEREKIRACIKFLTKKEQEVIRYIYFLNYKNAELARKLKISAASIFETKHRALRKLRKIYPNFLHFIGEENKLNEPKMRKTSKKFETKELQDSDLTTSSQAA